MKTNLNHTFIKVFFLVLISMGFILLGEGVSQAKDSKGAVIHVEGTWETSSLETTSFDPETGDFTSVATYTYDGDLVGTSSSTISGQGHITPQEFFTYVGTAVETFEGTLFGDSQGVITFMERLNGNKIHPGRATSTIVGESGDFEGARGHMMFFSDETGNAGTYRGELFLGN